LAFSAAIAARADELHKKGVLDGEISKYVLAGFNTAIQEGLLKGQVEKLNRDIFKEFDTNKNTILQTYFDAFRTGPDVTKWIKAENTPAVRNMVGRMLGLAPDNQAAANANKEDEDWYVSGPQRAMVDLTIRGLIQEAGPNGQIRAIPAY